MSSLHHLRKAPLAACLIAALSIAAVKAAPAKMPVDLGYAAAPGNKARALARFAGRAASRTHARAPIISGAGPITSVTNCSDHGEGSLRDAVASMPEAALIDLRGLTCSTITLTSGAIRPPFGLELIGPGAGALSVDANASSRVIETDFDLAVQGITLRNGAVDGNGGCVSSTSSELKLYDATVTGCYAHADANVAGGAIYSAAEVGLFNSRVEASGAYSDTAYAYGGGISARSLYADSSTITGNDASSGAMLGFGGGAFAQNNVTLHSSTVDNNRSDRVGAIGMFGHEHGGGHAVLIDSTVSNNSARRHIGGLFVDSAAYLLNSTIAFNCAGESDLGNGYIAAMGMHARFYAPYLHSTIISNNGLCTSDKPDQPAGSALDLSTRDVAGAITGDHNIVMRADLALPDDTLRGDPQLGPLADNGGPTLTRALLPGSIAIDAGNAFHAGTQEYTVYDQRGVGSSRIIGASADIGAYEVQGGAVHTASTCADSGGGSVRDTIERARSGDTIDLRSLGCATITLTTGAIEIAQGSLRLLGPGAAHLTIDGNQHDRVLHHTGYGTLDVEGMTIAHGYLIGSADASGGCVGSVSNVFTADVTIDSCSAVAGTFDYACNGGGLAAGAATLESSIVSNNHCGSPEKIQSNGGGVFTYGTLSMIRSTLYNNAAVDGYGGFFAYAANIVDSTIAHNSAGNKGGGGGAYSLNVTNSTISHNSANVEAGLIANRLDIFNSTVTANNTGVSSEGTGAGASGSGIIRVESSIIYGNASDAVPDDVGGTAIRLAGSHNLIGASGWTLPGDTLRVDPLLGPLQDNGGGVQTHALTQASPAIDAGDNRVGIADDERGVGFDRQVGLAPDIGAFEVQSGTHDTIFLNGFDAAAEVHVVSQ
jgi:hypothetical protein